MTDVGIQAFAFPLTPAQERLWRADRLRPGSPVFNGSFRWTLDGPLAPLLLTQTFNEIVRRHEALRTNFSASEAGPVQVIAPTTHLRIPLTDLRGLPHAERQIQMDRICAAEAVRGFDLERDKLIRVSLIQMDDEKFIVALTIHQIVADGWSIGIIMEELQVIYSALADGRRSQLPDPVIQFGDYAVWQNERITQRTFIDQLSYWQRKLVGYKRLEVTTDFPRPEQRTTSSAIVSVLLSSSISDSLKQFSSRFGGTMFITTLAACMVLMHRWTGRSDIAIGSPFAGRDRTDTEHLIGPLVNHAILRTEVDSNQRFSDFAIKTRDVVWEALANQEIPFEEVARTLQTDSGIYSDTFYGINFICQREYARASHFVFDFAGIRMSTMPSKSQGALYDLNFFLVEREVGWRLSVEFNTDLYSEQTAHQLLNDFHELLAQIAAEPDRTLSAFRLSKSLTSDNVGSSTTMGPGSATAPVGDALAVAANDTELHWLPASLTQERFWLLSKMASGTSMFNMPACVRISGPISHELLDKSFQLLVDRHEMLRTTFKEIDDQLVQVVTTAQNFALPIVTVEGVTQTEREANLMPLLLEEANRSFNLELGPIFRAKLFQLTDNDHALITTSHHIATDGWSQNIIQRDVWTIYQALEDHRQIELPSLTIHYGDFASWQKSWLTSDEAREHFDFWDKNLHGPLPVLDFPLDRPVATQAASPGAVEVLFLTDLMASTLKDLAKREHVTNFMLMATCFVALLVRYTNQTDIVIGSPVANRKPETDSAIGPFSGPFAIRVSASGNPTLRELLIRTSQACIDAFSHADLPFEALFERLKVRASRGRNPLFQFYFYCQTAFLQSRRLSRLSVTPMPTLGTGTPFELQLAVIDSTDGIRVQVEYNTNLFDANTIREMLRYHRDLLNIFASNLDLHIDDLESPARGAAQAARSATTVHRFVAPRDDDEMVLVEIWSKLFGLSRISIQDDFFDLGGHSLLAATLISEIHKKFGIRIDLSTLLVARTIEQLAQALATSPDSDSFLIPLRTGGTKAPLFCVHSAGGHVMGYHDLAEALPKDQPIYGLRAPHLDGARAFLTVDQLAALYLRDIRRVQKQGPYLLCGHSFGGLVAHRLAVQLSEEGEDVPLLTIFDTINYAYYRHLPFSVAIPFWQTFLVHRVRKFLGRLVRGDLSEITKGVAYHITTYVKVLIWKTARALGRLINRPIPERIQNNLILFDFVADQYLPKPFRGRLLLFRAQERAPEYAVKPDLGWDAAVNGGIDVHYIPGDHRSLLQQPNVPKLADQLTETLRQLALRT